MNIFEAVKQSVSTRQAAEYYGIRVRRNGMAVCPFHNDKHPSMKVDKRFHCFACQEDGDVIDFVARLYGLNPKEAAEKLAEDFNVTCDDWKYKKRVKVPIKQAQTTEQKYLSAEKHCFRVLADYLHLLQKWKIKYAPKPEDENWDSRFEESLQSSFYIEYLLDSLLSGTIEERAAIVLHYGKEMATLERRISEFITTDETGTGGGYRDNGTRNNGGRN